MWIRPKPFDKGALRFAFYLSRVDLEGAKLLVGKGLPVRASCHGGAC